MSDSVRRCLQQLALFGSSGDDVVISTNVPVRLDGLPRSDAREPVDPGAAVYWRNDNGAPKVMAVDIYNRVADNLAAIAETLDSMRSIQRHGGAAILDRAFVGFTALPAPIEGHKPWRDVLGLPGFTNAEGKNFFAVRSAYLRLRSATHPDRDSGNATAFNEIERAYAEAAAEYGINEIA